MPTYFRHTSGLIIESGRASTWEGSHGYERMTAKEGHAAYVEQCRQELLRFISPGTEVQCILRHVSRSGMKRCISLAIACIDTDGKPCVRRIDSLASTVTGYALAKDCDGIVVHGCGMDMGFQLVYTLGMRLWPNGTPEPHGRRNGEPDSDGGYALKHHWL